MAEPIRQLVEDLVCVECGRKWVGPVERWRLYLTEDDPPEPVAYCSACAERKVRLKAEMPGRAGPPARRGVTPGESVGISAGWLIPGNRLDRCDTRYKGSRRHPIIQSGASRWAEPVEANYAESRPPPAPQRKGSPVRRGLTAIPPSS